MDDRKIQEIREGLQSSHVNFLFGAGLSTPYLPLLGDIEIRLSRERKSAERIKIKKEYFEKVMIPNLEIINNDITSSKQNDFNITQKAYKDFFELIGHILLHRKNTILSKQVNIFTTNIDILMEVALEELNMEYNDGFSGRLNSVFSLSNFKRSILKRSLHYENVSEVPIFNLVKIHGSLTWKKIEDKIFFSKLTHFDKSLLKKSGKKFDDNYKKLAIVNPEKKKLEETVMDLTYYELLRMYSSELEKENVILFIMGFSMEDEHIREITIRGANSNPTLKIYLISHEKDTNLDLARKMEIGKLRYSNIEIVEPEDGEQNSKLSLTVITKLIFEKVVKNIAHDNKD
ncbi:MAG: SIR2 family protein [Candidatus Parcubacteria bacterium]|nr:SIR2 family protein [Candidatus Parcubacteria bacterium]